jgi:hypothetical protein
MRTTSLVLLCGDLVFSAAHEPEESELGLERLAVN